MKVKSYLSMLGIAAMLASCSSEDVLQTDNNSGKNAVTFTATLDAGMLTRATGDDDNTSVTRAIVEVYEEDATATTKVKVGERVEVEKGTDGKFTFTIPDLVSGKEYTFLFWADDNSSYDITELTAVTTSSDPTLAYSLVTTQTPEQISQDGVELKHAVSKISLRTTEAVEAGKNITLSVPTYTTFNILENTATGDLRTTNVTSTQNEAVEANATVASVYVLGTDEAQTEKVTVQYDGRPTMLEYTNLPLSPNKHIVIQGDVNDIGITTASFTATLDENWDENTFESPNKYSVNSETHTIVLLEAGNLTEDAITAAVGEGSELIISGDNMNEDDFTTLKTWMYANEEDKKMSITLEDVTSLPSMALFKNEDETDGVNNLYVLKLPKVTTIGYNAICLYNMDELWITAKGDITDEGWAATAIASGMKLYVHEDKKEGGDAKPTVTLNETNGLYYWGEGAASYIYYVNDAGEIVE